MSLGEVDYGLYGVVGGLSVFVMFLNSEMANAVGRYFAVAVGGVREVEGGEADLEDCHRWFNTALMIHLVLPFVLVLIGCPCGTWAVQHFLNIPQDRVEACLWVWRATCATSYFSMSTVPFLAMYTAKQRIAERTVYEVAQTVANVGLLYYMISFPQDWLSKYAWAMFLLSTTPKLLLSFSALRHFPECKVVFAYWGDWKRIKELTGYAGLRLWGSVAWMLQSQGTTIVINKFLGATKNAAATVGNTIASHTTVFASSMSGALWPAAMNAYGAGDMPLARVLAHQASKIGTLTILVFAIPVAIEVDELLLLWLKTPPAGAAMLALFVLGAIIIDRSTNGFELMIYARGEIAYYELMVAVDCVLTFATCFALLYWGWGVFGVGISFVFQKSFDLVVRLWLVGRKGDLSVRHWMRTLFFPICLSMVLAIIGGLIPRLLMPQSFLRVVLTTINCEILFIPLVWFVVLDVHERSYVVDQLRRKLGLNKRGTAA